MKKCPACGKQYADDRSLCVIDGAVLESAGDQLIGQMLGAGDKDNAAATAQGLGGSSTDAYESPGDTVGGAPDEATAVTAAGEPPPGSAGENRGHINQPPPAPSSHVWRVLVPALIILVMVFGLLYAYGTRSGEATDGEGRAPLTSDPNGRPVQAIKPPSGESERDIVPSTVSVTTSSPTETATPSGGTGGSADPNEIYETTGLPTPTPVENPMVISSGSLQTSDDKDAESKTPPIPSPSNKNVNQQPTPTPANATPDAIKVQPEVKPTATPAAKPQTPVATPKPAVPPAQNSPPPATPPQ